MKTERLPDLLANAGREFYLQTFNLPYTGVAIPNAVDPTMTDFLDVTAHDGNQLGFAILREDNTVEIVDAVTGEHIRLTFGQQSDDDPEQQAADALMQVVLIESRSLSASLAEIIGYLERKDHLAAMGTFQGLGGRFKFLEAVLEASARAFKT